MTLEWDGENVSGEALCYRPRDRALSVSDTLAAWRTDERFTAGFAKLLAGIPFDAFLWETPPMTRATLDRPFEFTVTDCPALSCTPDPSPFRNQLEVSGSSNVARFRNLGGDATLIVPEPVPEGADYAHLAAFARNAPEALQHRLWRAVAEALDARIASRPLWLSTSGLGVAWLHVRVDDSPKYYSYAPYRRFPYRHGNGAGED